MAALPILPPQLPPWDGFHPLVVHFPIALLLVAPLFVLLGFLPRIGRGFRLAALVLFILGTIGTYVAGESGEASAQVIDFTPEARATVEHHADLAGTTQVLFTIVTLVYALLLSLPWLVQKLLHKKLPRPVPVVLTILFLIGTGLCVNVLAHTADLGGRLVYVDRVENWVLENW